MSTNTSQLKLVSNSLARLYRMQFLKRKRVERICKQGEKTFNRGYQFNYCLTKQGWNHIEYLKDRVRPSSLMLDWAKPLSYLIRDPDILPFIMGAAKLLPGPIKNLAPSFIMGLN